jgi:hypothetical protein
MAQLVQIQLGVALVVASPGDMLGITWAHVNERALLDKVKDQERHDHELCEVDDMSNLVT